MIFLRGGKDSLYTEHVLYLEKLGFDHNLLAHVAATPVDETLQCPLLFHVNRTLS